MMHRHYDYTGCIYNEILVHLYIIYATPRLGDNHLINHISGCKGTNQSIILVFFLHFYWKSNIRPLLIVTYFNLYLCFCYHFFHFVENLNSNFKCHFVCLSIAMFRGKRDFLDRFLRKKTEIFGKISYINEHLVFYSNLLKPWACRTCMKMD